MSNGDCPQLTCGFIAGIVMGNNSGYDFSFAVALVCWISALVSGTMMLGFAEIIELLFAIKTATNTSGRQTVTKLLSFPRKYGKIKI